MFCKWKTAQYTKTYRIRRWCRGNGPGDMRVQNSVSPAQMLLSQYCRSLFHYDPPLFYRLGISLFTAVADAR